MEVLLDVVWKSGQFKQFKPSNECQGRSEAMISSSGFAAKLPRSMGGL